MAKKTAAAKGYSIESIRKVTRLMMEARTAYMQKDIDNIKMAISAGNRKIGRVLNVSLPPIMTCANCKECMHFCYDIKACLQYPNTVIDARVRNLVILLKDRDEYFSRIIAKIARRRMNKYFRWHVAGDIVDADYFDRMVQVARLFPEWIFWTYTKNYTVVNAWIAANGGTRAAVPSNLHVMFSEWRGLPMVNPYGMPEFSCHFPDEPEPATFKCPGNCDVCKLAGRGCVAGENVHADLH